MKKIKASELNDNTGKFMGIYTGEYCGIRLISANKEMIFFNLVTGSDEECFEEVDGKKVPKVSSLRYDPHGEGIEIFDSIEEIVEIVAGKKRSVN